MTEELEEDAGRIGVFSTVYPAAETYLDDFFTSLASQSDTDFDLFLANDGVANLDEMASRYDLHAHTRGISGSPAQIRKRGIAWAIHEEVDWLVFLDSDDRAGADRIANIRNSVASYDALFHDLLMFGHDIDEPISFLGDKFATKTLIKIEDLRDKNFMGFSNTAARCGALKPILERLPDDIVALDWALFTVMALKGARMGYLDGAPTHYRQHAGNVAGPGDVSDHQVLRGVGVKAHHYDFFRPYGAPYDRLATDFAALRARLDMDEPFFREYCRAVRENSPEHPLWWEPMKLPEEIGL